MNSLMLLDGIEKKSTGVTGEREESTPKKNPIAVVGADGKEIPLPYKMGG